MGKHFPLSLLTPYLNCSQLWNSVRLRTNMGCVLAYIPSLVGVASIWAAVLCKRYLRDAYGGYSLRKCCLSFLAIFFIFFIYLFISSTILKRATNLLSLIGKYLSCLFIPLLFVKCNITSL